MLDIGWQEIFIISALALIVVGPKDLPRALRTVMLGVKKVRGLANEFQSGVNEMVREADLDDLKKEMEKIKDEEIERDLKYGVVRNDLKGDLGLGEIKDDLNKIAKEDTPKPASAPIAPASGAPKVVAERKPAAKKPAAKSSSKQASSKKPSAGKANGAPAAKSASKSAAKASAKPRPKKSAKPAPKTAAKAATKAKSKSTGASAG